MARLARPTLSTGNLFLPQYALCGYPGVVVCAPLGAAVISLCLLQGAPGCARAVAMLRVGAPSERRRPVVRARRSASARGGLHWPASGSSSSLWRASG
jgi:hypothetical protein